MTLKAKVVAVLAMVIGLFAAVTGTVYLSLEVAKSDLDKTAAGSARIAATDLPLLLLIKEIKIDVIQVQQWLTDISATRGLDGLNDGLDTAARFAEKFHRDVAAARELAADLENEADMGMDDRESLTAILDKIEKEFPPYYATGQRLAKAYIDYGPAEGNRMMAAFDEVAETIGDTTDKLVAAADEHTRADLDELAADSSMVRDANASLILLVIGLTLVALLLATTGAAYLFREISGNIRMLQDDLGTLSDFAVSDNSTAVGLVTRENRKDEFGAVGAALKLLLDYLAKGKELAAEQLRRQEEKARQGERLERLTGKFSDDAGQIIKIVSSASTELESTAQSMTASAEETSRQAAAVAAASTQASQNVQTVATASEELGASIAEIGRQATQSAKIAGRAVEEADRTDEVVRGLSESAQRISEVVNLINDIAGQTNLLALNATIEAARAGEAGKGFAVVAQEVKNLANQTAKATEEISTQIQSVQDETQGAVGAIETIRHTINEMSDIATTIASAVEEQNAATREINRNVQQAAKGTDEVSSNIDGVSRAAGETGSSSTQVLQASSDLNQQAERLRAEIERFITDVKAA